MFFYLKCLAELDITRRKKVSYTQTYQKGSSDWTGVMKNTYTCALVPESSLEYSVCVVSKQVEMGKMLSVNGKVVLWQDTCVYSVNEYFGSMPLCNM